MDNSQEIERPEAFLLSEEARKNLSSVGTKAAAEAYSNVLSPILHKMEECQKKINAEANKKARGGILPGIAVGLVAVAGLSIAAPAAFVLLGGATFAAIGTATGVAGGHLFAKTFSSVDKTLLEERTQLKKQFDEISSSEKTGDTVWAAFKKAVETTVRDNVGGETNRILQAYYSDPKRPEHLDVQFSTSNYHSQNQFAIGHKMDNALETIKLHIASKESLQAASQKPAAERVRGGAETTQPAQAV